MTWRYLAILVAVFTALGLGRRSSARTHLLSVLFVVLIVGYQAVRLHTL